MENQLLPFLRYQNRIALQPLIKVHFLEEVSLYLAHKCNSLPQTVMLKVVSDSSLVLGSSRTCPSMETQDGGGMRLGGERAVGRCTDQGCGIESLL